MTGEPMTPSERRATDESLGELLSDVTRDLSTLIRQEMELARAEFTRMAVRASRSAGLFGGAGYAALMAVFFLSIALWWGLGYVMGNAWSAVVVAVIWAIIGLILYLAGRNQLKTVEGMPQTVETVKEIPETLKRNGENR
ncbi:phage holin family protein [Microbacterium rhizosphaerae]|uniref:Phage holin family protein n=1 Tax=Microbacterium rhizosphaerae TaxID=1678237 RepID=A0ABZ0SJ56_9MICO|nr:phage holin family protein [Microbacterium rhizosphaerae]WPR89399.1 phage holin family protein [Microbacterium rhizosphaerae]